MAQAMQFLSSSSSSSCASRPSGCVASVFGHAGVARQHGRGPAGSACISMKNVGQRLLLQREADVQQLMIKGSGWSKAGAVGKQAKAGMAVVCAGSAAIGVVEDVRTEVKGMYYNVTLSVEGSSDVAKWYQTPGQFVQLLPAQCPGCDGASSFFIASPVPQQVGERLSLEFLIEIGGAVSIQLANSKPGDTVFVGTNVESTGFNVSKLQPIECAESVLMFASGYGLSPIRAFIETGFQAKERKHAILLPMFTHRNQTPWLEKQPKWEKTGVTVASSANDICNIDIDPAKTVVLLVATVQQQKMLIDFFERKGVPYDKILTLFPGIPREDETFINKVLRMPNFPPMGKLHVPFELKI